MLATIALPTLLPVLTGLIPHRRGVSKRSHARAVGTDIVLAASHVGLTVTLLAHQAWLMTDAIIRTLWRVSVTRRNLLEWMPAAQAKSGSDLSLGSVYHRMCGAVVLAAAAGVLVLLARPEAWPMAAPFVLLWALSPLVARWLSLPPHTAGEQPLAEDDTRLLRLTARRTWSFFETFVTPEHHALPPDNFQEEPIPIVAHRTSPTNLGLYLLSAFAAYDFGWIGALTVAERLEATLGTMNGLERFRGHFFNWYDTRSSAARPQYVSSVDSGNLAGHLVALGQACQDILTRPVLGPQVLSGITDAVCPFVHRRTRSPTTGAPKRLPTSNWTRRSIHCRVGPTPTTPVDWVLRLTEWRLALRSWPTSCRP